MDVTTLKTTPTHAMTANPLSTVARVNGGVFRISFSWRRSLGRTTPNRWLSASRPVGPNSMTRRFRLPGEGDLPPPRAQENVRGKARPLSRASAEMGRSTDADGERERARASPSDSLHRRLDKRCFIDGMAKRSAAMHWRSRCVPVPLPSTGRGTELTDVGLCPPLHPSEPRRSTSRGTVSFVIRNP